MPGTFFAPYGRNNDRFAAANSGVTGRFPLGHYLILPDGRRYRFALNDTTTEVAGSLYQGAAPVSNFTDVVVNTARAIGDTVVSATLGATSMAADLMSEGTAHVNDATGEGYTYRIARAVAAADANAGVASSGVATVNLVAGETIQVALTVTTTQVTFTQNRFHTVIIHPAPPTAVLAGVSPGVATTGQYYWSQVAGEAAILCRVALFAGHPVQADVTTNGAIEQKRLRMVVSGTAAVDTNSFGFLQDASGTDTVAKLAGVSSGDTVDITGPIAGRSAPVGVCVIANATTEHALVNITDLD